MACKIPVPVIHKGSFLEQVKEETKGHQLTQIHVENGRQSGGGGGGSLG